MSIITDIGKTVRNRIVGEKLGAPKGLGYSESAAAAPSPSEPNTRRPRSSAQRSVGADNGQQAGPAQQIGNTSSRLASETPAVFEATTKSDTVLRLLRQLDGATLADLMAVTSWQRHSVRGFLSGTVRKRLGPNLFSGTTVGGERRYRIQSCADADSTAPIDATVSSCLSLTTDDVDAPTDTAVC